MPLWIADQLVETNRAWLDRQIRRRSAVLERLGARPDLFAGRELMIGGRTHRVEWVRIEGLAQHGGSSPDGRFLQRPQRPRRNPVIEYEPPTDPGIGWVRIVSSGASRNEALNTLERWLRDQAGALIRERVATFAPVLDVRPRRVSIRDPRTRWGSASARGTLSFSWRLVLVPQEVLDYVVVHELAHLREPNHSPRFWVIVEQIVAEHRSIRRWMRQHHQEIHAALD